MARVITIGAICFLLSVVLIIAVEIHIRNRMTWRSDKFRFPNGLNCPDQMCSHFVTDRDLPYWRYCSKKAKRYMNEAEKSMGTCHFINGVGRYPVALASFPGSGNTWVRGLLQQITGVCTGSIYCDATLRQRGFLGEGIKSGNTLVIKTHQTDPRWSGVTYSQSEPFKYFKKLRDVPLYGAAILIVRNPYDALVAEWHREQTRSLPDNHIAYVGLEHFRDNADWDAYVHKWAVRWQDTIIGWLLGNKQHPVMVVKFEDLKTNATTEVMRMLDFLQAPYTREKVLEVVTGGFDAFRRKRRLSTLECYTPQQVEHVRDTLTATARLLESRNLTHVCNILDYNITIGR